LSALIASVTVAVAFFRMVLSIGAKRTVQRTRKCQQSNRAKHKQTDTKRRDATTQQQQQWFGVGWLVACWVHWWAGGLLVGGGVCSVIVQQPGCIPTAPFQNFYITVATLIYCRNLSAKSLFHRIKTSKQVLNAIWLLD
jgi:hypothetical protein